MLSVLGVTDDEDEVYRQLVTVTSASLPLIARVTGLDEDRAREALVALVSRGFAEETDGWYRAAPPEVAERLIDERMQQLRDAQAAVAELRRTYRERQRTTADMVELITGAREVAAVTRRIHQGAREEVLTLSKMPFVAFDPGAADPMISSPQVVSKTVFDTEILALPGMLDQIERYHWRRDQHRSYQGVPVKLMIVDRSVAVLPFHYAGDNAVDTVMLVRPCVLLTALITVFEAIWLAAVPLMIGPNTDLAPSPESPLSVDDSRLLSQLVAGLTDEAIATHMGVSVRTVQRRVQALMSATHASTRMQLAWLAGRSGWLSWDGHMAGADGNGYVFPISPSAQ
jgi:predicted transcriptional regulator